MVEKEQHKEWEVIERMASSDPMGLPVYEVSGPEVAFPNMLPSLYMNQRDAKMIANTREVHVALKEMIHFVNQLPPDGWYYYTRWANCYDDYKPS